MDGQAAAPPAGAVIPTPTTATASTGPAATPARPSGLNGRAASPAVTRPANIATRFAAFLVDVVAVNVLFTLGAVVIERVLGLFTGRSVTLTDAELAYRIGFGVWVFAYCAYPLATAGQTAGMAVLGLRAVRPGGVALSPARAVLRVVVFPLSFLLFGAGFVLIVLRRDHRALHDLLAGSSVVYATTR